MRLVLILALALAPSLLAQESLHRAEQDREISYWLLDPGTHQFRISHDFTVTRPGNYYQSFERTSRGVKQFLGDIRGHSAIRAAGNKEDRDVAEAFEGRFHVPVVRVHVHA